MTNTAEQALRNGVHWEGPALRPIQTISPIAACAFVWLGGDRWLAVAAPSAAWACGWLYFRIMGGAWLERRLRKLAKGAGS